MTCRCNLLSLVTIFAKQTLCVTSRKFPGSHQVAQTLPSACEIRRSRALTQSTLAGLLKEGGSATAARE
jgi:hypothetical protein